MPIKSRWSIPITEVSLPTWLFGSPNGPLSDARALNDANRPDTHYLTFEQFRLWSKRVAVGLQKAGLQPGDRVLLFSGNTLFFPVVFMGIVMAGGIFTGANPTYVARELAHQLKDSDAKFLLCADGSLDVGIEAASIISMGKERVFIFDDLALEGTGKGRLGVRNWNTLFATVGEASRFAWKDARSPKDTTCCLNYSSGTTGVPKGVEITHYNYVANAEQVIALASLRPDFQERRKTSRWLCALPMYHAYGIHPHNFFQNLSTNNIQGQTFFITIGPKLGIPVYIMPKFDFLQLLSHVQRFKITELSLVPPIVVALAKHPDVKNFDLSSVRNIGSGAAPLSQSVAEEVNKLWPSGEINLKQGWGMTETTCSVMGWDPLSKSHSSSVGELLANCEAKLMNAEGTAEVPRGTAGELWVRAPNVMKGYWRNPAATSETLTPDRWLKTGDICYVDEHNRFTIVDRKKELIKVKGNQVAPAELEGVLLEHEMVADAAVVGVTIDGEEKPRAYVVLKEDAKGRITGGELVKWMDSRVARHKRLTAGVVFVDAIPKNPVSSLFWFCLVLFDLNGELLQYQYPDANGLQSGKILRKLLRQRAKKEVGDSDVKNSRL